MEPAISLRITGFQPDEPAGAVTSVVGRLLLTPEALLAAHGIRFDLPPVAEQPLVADRSPVAKGPEMRLAQEVTRWPRRLLWVEPAYADPARKVRHEGEVELAGIVGSDGRIREPQILTALAEAHQRHVQRAFSLWRFEPARRGSQPIAARVTERTVLRIY
jgi:TonB family protein